MVAQAVVLQVWAILGPVQITTEHHMHLICVSSYIQHVHVYSPSVGNENFKLHSTHVQGAWEMSTGLT